MLSADRKALLARMKANGGGPMALQMEVYDLQVRALRVLERIAAALEAPLERIAVALETPPLAHPPEGVVDEPPGGPTP